MITTINVAANAAPSDILTYKSRIFSHGVGSMVGVQVGDCVGSAVRLCVCRVGVDVGLFDGGSVGAIDGETTS